MATSNRIRALNRLPFDFEDGLKVGGVDVTSLNQAFTPAGAGLIGFTPVGNLSAGNVQAALAELDNEKVGFARLDDTDGSSLVGYDGGTVQDVLDAVTGPNGAASVGYTPAGIGAVPTSVQENLRLLQVRPEDFGAVGNYIADDTIPMIMASDEARTSGRVLAGDGNYRVTNTINLRYASVDMSGRISVDHTGIGVILGNSQDNQSGPAQKIQTVLRTVGLDATNPTVRVIGAKGQVITVHRCDYLQVYANTNSDVASTDLSTAYSSFHLQRCSKIELTNNPSTNGSLVQWINENTFHIGRTSTLLINGTYGHNHNQFFAGAFENGVITLGSGASNIIHCGRFEGGASVTFDAGTFSNKIIQSWASNQRSDYEDDDVTIVNDAGEANIVARFSDAYRQEIPMLVVNPATCNSFTTGASSSIIHHTSLSGVNLMCHGIGKFSSINNAVIFSTPNIQNIPISAGDAIRFKAPNGRFRIRFQIYDANGVQITGATDPEYLRTNANTAWNSAGYYVQSSDTVYAMAILKPGTPVAFIGVRILAGSEASGVPFDGFELTLLTTDRTGRAARSCILQSSTNPAVSASPTRGFAPEVGYKISNVAGGWFTCTFSLKTALSAPASSGSSTVTLITTAGVSSGDIIGVLLTDGSTHWATVSGAPSGSTVTLASALLGDTFSGAAVVVNRWIAS